MYIKKQTFMQNLIRFRHH